MKNNILTDLSADEMRELFGGTSNFRCWGGGVMTVLGFMSGNPVATAAGLWFIYDYC